MTVLVHIGYPKTGTTWLQDRFFSREPLFRVLGGHYEIDEWIIRPHGLKFDAERAHAHFASGIAEARETGRVALMSSEKLCGNPFFGGRESCEVADRLKQTFPNARILITIRNQISVLASVYKQYVSRGGVLPHEEFFQPEEEPGYYYFDSGYYEYDRLVAKYVELFGAGSVKVMLNEDLAEDSYRFCREIVSFATGDPTPDVTPPDPERSHVGADDYVLSVLRRINHFRTTRLNPWPCVPLGPVARYAYRGTGKAGRIVCHALGVNPKNSRLRTYIKSRFGETYLESNARLSRLLGRNLAAFGYPMSAEPPVRSAAEEAEDGAPRESAIQLAEYR